MSAYGQIGRPFVHSEAKMSPAEAHNAELACKISDLIIGFDENALGERGQRALDDVKDSVYDLVQFTEDGKE